MFTETRRAVFVFAMLAVLYFYGLTKTGVLGPDEPRYAAIGLEMARSGDWITPRLWGTPWFEKPPLLYWMTALGKQARLPSDLASRLPVALTGFGFLLFLFWWVREEFGETEALYSVALLGTCAGWVAYSFAAVTDMPLSATFGAGLLLSLRLRSSQDSPKFLAVIAGALLGLAVLAKGLGPLVLFVPAAFILRTRIRALLKIAVTCLVVAAPWNIVCALRYGHAFVDELYWKQHFQRFVSGVQLHPQPVAYYVPILLAGLLPWTPVLVLLFRSRPAIDFRLKFLGLWTICALVFFSISRGKLPGYVLPLLPVICVLAGIALAKAQRTWIPLALAALLVGSVPPGVALLPQALTAGLSRSKLPAFEWQWLIAGVACAAACLALELKSRRSDAVMLVTLVLAVVLLKAKIEVLPLLDESVSARAFYQRYNTSLEGACLQDVSPSAAYGLDYYANRTFPVCSDPASRPKIVGVGNNLILLD